MRRAIITFIFLISFRPVFTQTVIQGVQAAHRQERLTQTQALYFEALAVHAPELLPETYRFPGALPEKSAFSLNFRLQTRWTEFTTDQKVILEPFLIRPVLPLSHVSPSGRFRIHYTLSGIDQVSNTDVDGSGIPDYIEATAQSMDTAYTVIVDQIGFQSPPDDGGVDGPEWDVYIQNLAGVYGWTNVEELISQNPDVYSAYMKLDNNYTHTPTKGLDGLRVTTAHEFLHMVHLGYNGRDDDNNGSFDDIFLMEASSTWMEDVVYDDVNDYVFYLPSFFNRTNTPFNTSNGSWEYGLSLWFHFLEERTGGRTFARDIWEHIITVHALDALDSVLRADGRFFDYELALFWGWNYFTGSRAQPTMFYPEGALYPELLLDGSLVFSHDTTLAEDIRHLSARYFHFTHESDYTYTLIPMNFNRTFDAPEGEFTVVIGTGTNQPKYTDLPGGVQVRLSALEILRWKCVAITEREGIDPVLSIIAATPAGDITKNLPACYPQPFIIPKHSMTTIPFNLNNAGSVSIVITHASGRVALQIEERFEGEGLQFYHWDGRNRYGDLVPSGIYLYLVLKDDLILRQEKIAVVR